MKSKKSIPILTAMANWSNFFKRFVLEAICVTPSSHLRTLAFVLLLLAASTGMVQAQNLIANGDFASGTTGWTGNNFSVVSGEAFISSSNSGGNLWDTQLVKGSLSFTVSTQYTLSFRARAAANRNITVAIQNVGGAWTDQFRQQYALTTTMQTFTTTFTASSTNANVQIGFLMAAQSSTAAIYYDDVSLTVANPPTLAATTAASSITTTSAVSGGNVTSQGGGSVTARGVVWSTSTSPTVALTTKTTDGTGTGSFTSNITGLSSGVKYYVRSYATNSSGTAYGAEINFTTLDTEAPTAFTATKGAVTFNSVALLLNATDNSGLINYTISYGSGPTVVNTTGTSGVQKSQVITGLTASTDYTFSIVAKDASNNAAANNPIIVTATTTENTNTECSGTSTEKLQDFDFLTGYNYTFSTTGSGSTASVKVDFELLDDRSGVIAYAWTYNPNFAEVGMTLVSGKKFTKTFTNQTIGATFTVACKFAFAGGSSVTKKFLYTVGNSCLTVPGKPTSVVATSGNAQASIAFTAPVINGGSAILDYTVTSSPGGNTATGSSSPIVVTGLTNGTAYTFTVTARNAQGTSAASSASNSVTPIAAVPGAPIIGTATAGNAQASVTFTAPSNVGDSPITGYTVTSSPGNNTATGSSSPIVVTGLTNGTAYTFTVTATNTQGTSVPSVVSNSVTPATVPGAPTIGTATRGNTQVSVAFTAPASNGGSAITGYSVTSSPGDITATGSSSPIVVTGLTNGTTYTFIVTATNSLGTSTASAASNTATPINDVPEVAASTPPTRAAGDVLSIFSDAYTPIAGTTDFFPGWGQATTVSNISVAGNTTMKYSTFNYEGTNLGSDLNLTSLGMTHIHLDVWSPDETLIRLSLIQRTPQSERPVNSTITPYTWNSIDIPISDFTSQSSFLVSAIYQLKMEGSGWYPTNTGVRSTVYIDNVYFYKAVPEAPTSILATAGKGQALIAFTAPGVTGGSAIIDYTVTSSPGNITATAASSPIKVTGLSNGTDYTFTVTARNTQGTGAASAASNSVTPHATNNNISVSSATNISALTLTPVSDIVVSGNVLTINQATNINSITVAPGAKLTVTGTNSLTATSGITLESDATGTATIVDSYENPTLNATVKQFVSAGRNWYISAPVNNTPDNFSVLNKGTSVQEYNEATGLWVIKTSGTLTRGKGYVQVAGSTEGSTGTVDFAGTTNSGDVGVTLTNNAEGGKGFNLVGNPYPSYLNWQTVAGDNAAANMPTGTMWYRTTSYNGKSAWTPITAYDLNDVVYNGNRFYKVTSAGTSGAAGGPTGTTTSTEGDVTWAYQGSIYIFATVNADGQVTPSTVSNLVPPMQAFWVKSTGGTLTFKNSMRSHESVSNKLKAPKVLDTKMLRLSITNGASADESVIYSSTKALNSFDSYDAPKYFNTTGTNQPEIYSQVGSEKLAINAMNEMNIGTEIQLGFLTEKENIFSISASEIINFDSNTHIILKDKLLNSEYNLTNGSAYNFSSDIVNNSDRFSIQFRAPGVTTDIDNTINLNAKVFVNAANQITIIAPEKSIFSIFNAVGQLIENGRTTSNNQTSNFKYAAGVYVIRVNDQSTRVVIK